MTTKAKLAAHARMNRAAAFGRAAKIYTRTGQSDVAYSYAKQAGHEVESPRMRKAIQRKGAGGGEVHVQSHVREGHHVDAYERSRPGLGSRIGKAFHHLMAKTGPGGGGECC